MEKLNFFKDKKKGFMREQVIVDFVDKDLDIENLDLIIELVLKKKDG